MILSEVEQKRIQAIELDLFHEFVTICEELGVRYYIIGGTLLGAVRHKGFIPWDDDIDVGMHREDYSRFVKYAGSMLPEGLFLQTHNSDKEYHSNAAKIRNSNTTYIESCVNKSRINHGVFIDIFPLDNYPVGKMKEAVFCAKKRIISLRINSVFQNMHYGGMKKIVQKGLRLIYPTLYSAVNAREKLYLSVPQTGLIVNHSGAWGNKEIIPTEWYAEGCQLEFEGMRVTAPKEYEKWLNQVYGDYMKLPPQEKRVTHHITDVIDFENPYTMYFN